MGNLDSPLLAGQLGVAGLSVAGFSTIVDLLHSINAAFKLWQDFSDLDDEVAFFRAQVTLQQDVLETWQRDWCDFPVGSISSSGRTRLLRQHSETVEGVLRSVKTELAKLSPLAILNHVQTDPSTSQRVGWVMSKKDVAEASLKRIESLLHGLFLILPLQSKNPEMKLLISLLYSLGPSSSSKVPGLTSANPDIVKRGFDLRNLRAGLEADLERRVEEFQQSIPEHSMIIPRPSPDLTLEEGTAGSRSRGLLDDTPFIVEWKSYEAWQGQRAILLRGRNDILAQLLNATSKPEELLTFHCKGYFDDVEFKRYGFVFDTPARPGEDLISLNKLLGKPTIEWLPSLGQRYQIAYSLGLTISILLATGWLHKGIRSHNVLLVRQGDTVRWMRPYLCGFTLSRPDKPNEISEKIEHGERFNVYRHPLAQGQPNESYRKSYDIYSFGVILFEIGSWTTFPPWGDSKSAKAFRAELTSKAAQQKIAHRMGTEYCNAMIQCLDGFFEDKGDLVSTLFYSEVVEPLGRVVPL